MSKKKLQWVNFLRYANLAISFGLTMVAAVFLGIYGGWWVDRRLGTFPVFMLIGIFLGVGAGFYSLWSELAGLTEKESKKKLKRKKDGNDENDAKRE
ncbi:MAG: AtpZ/AtpI family protein [Firmicutes bacterium]|nr:AtpZ/AtpI family protein [Bacillota bacterium]